jgi:Ohr subfamily peroxiredoxin
MQQCRLAHLEERKHSRRHYQTARHGDRYQYRWAQCTTTPEHLFAAGYAACFGGALEYGAHQHKNTVSGSVVTCHTSVGPREGGGFGIAIRMHVKVPTLPSAAARALVEETHEKICPYSHATRGNIDFVLEVEGASYAHRREAAVPGRGTNPLRGRGAGFDDRVEARRLRLD